MQATSYTNRLGKIRLEQVNLLEPEVEIRICVGRFLNRGKTGQLEIRIKKFQVKYVFDPVIW